MSASVDALLHAADPEAVERRILCLAMERTGGRHGAIFVREGREARLSVAAHVVQGVEVALPHVQLRKRTDGRPNGIAWHVVDTRAPYLTNDAPEDPHYAPYFLEVGSIVAVPLLYQGRAIGALTVSSRRRGDFTQAHVAELEQLAAESMTFLRRAQLYRKEQAKGGRPALIKGLSPEWLEVEHLLERVSATDLPVLVRGESGTGKELVAHAIHFNSPRAERPFVSINCAAIPEQLLESTLFGHVKGAFTGAAYAKVGELQKADGGTLFLDEVGELSPLLQAKVLRAIELGEVQPLGSNDPPHRVDARFIAATNRDLEAMRRAGTFRDDLYFRLAVVTLNVPPLRSYLQHLEILCQTFLSQAARAHGRRVRGMSAAALDKLQQHDFPGNMRELRNLIERAVVVSDGPLLRPEDLPLPGGGGPAAPTPVEAPPEKPTLAELRRTWVAEREGPHLRRVLEEAGGDVAAAAAVLGIDRTTLYRLLKKHAVRTARLR